jgi:CBS domain-containing protein
MSPRAACRLETIGFEAVYDYVAGKADWLAHNRPVDGDHADMPTAGRAARGDVVTCRLEGPIGAVRERIERSPYGFGLVTTPGGVVLGRLWRNALDGDLGEPAERLMQPGPSTVRPDEPAPALAKRLAERRLEAAIVTTPEGILIGVASREALEHAG